MALWGSAIWRGISYSLHLLNGAGVDTHWLEHDSGSLLYSSFHLIVLLFHRAFANNQIACFDQSVVRCKLGPAGELCEVSKVAE